MRLSTSVFGTAWKQVQRGGLMSLAAIILATGFVGAAFAQSPTGTFTGTITDAQGAAMVGVKVVARNVDTGVDQQPVETNNSGSYLIPLLPPGTYDITASQTGFATVKRPALPLQVGQTVRIDVEMPVASQQSLVTVTTEVPLLETEKTEQSQNVSENLVSNLPVSSRRWEQFVMLTPGVTPDGSGGAVSFHGLNSLYNSNSVDGANNNSNYGGGARGGTGDGYIYSGDSIREFQVSSSGFSAELGQAAGGAVNAVTKSGTNAIHGDLFYNGRSANFNAIDPLVSIGAAKNGQTPTQAVHQQHQYGASVGGPLLKDKLFFFATVDGYRKINPLSTTTSQLSPSIRDFTCPKLPSGATYSQTLLNSQCAAAKDFVFTRIVGDFARSLRQDVELLKLDYQLNQANHFSAVTNFRDYKQPTDTTSVSGGTSYNQDRFVIANWTIVPPLRVASIAARSARSLPARRRSDRGVGEESLGRHRSVRLRPWGFGETGLQPAQQRLRLHDPDVRLLGDGDQVVHDITGHETFVPEVKGQRDLMHRASVDRDRFHSPCHQRARFDSAARGHDARDVTVGQAHFARQLR